MAAKTLSRMLALLAFTASAAYGLGLGDIRLLSSLNAPLDAEIELVGATAEDLAGLKAQIASRETFARYKLEWPAFMGSITVQPMRTSDGRDVIKLRSSETATEPFLTLLVEANWARGKLVREYTVLLDPPVYTPGQNTDTNAPVRAPVTDSSDRGGRVSRPVEPSRPSAAAVPAPASSNTTSAETTRVVRSGDTLSRIAGEIAGQDPRASRRWMLAIYRANPRAFDGNMNILRSGAELQIPASSAAENIGANEASAEIRQQYAAWRDTAPAAPATDAEPGRLRLVPPAAESGAATAGTTTQQSGAETAALQGRVRELEGQLLESRRLIELRNAELAQLQARISSQSAGPVTPPPTSDAGAEVEMETPAAEAPAAPTAAPGAEATAPAEEIESTPVAAPSKPAAASPTAAAPTEPEGSLLDTLKDYWWVLAAVLVAILALLGLKAWRTRKESEFDDSLGRLATAGGPSMGSEFGTRDTASMRTIAPPPPNFVVEETGTHERPRFGAEAAAAPRNVATEDTISSDTAINLDQGDPLAEADFHMAYGLYDQAADLIRIAIAREPERRDLRLKLLEVFFVWGNKEQFLQSARELAQTRHQAAPGEWEKIMIMGKQLAPEEPLFASGAGLSAAAAGGVDLDLEGGQSRVDFDLLGGPVPGLESGDGVDLDIGSALGDKDFTHESSMRTTDAHLALQEKDFSGNATTRQMTQRLTSEEPAPIMPEFGLEESEDAPTVEQPGMHAQGGNPTIRQKVDMALRQGGVDQTAEINIDDLGLDLSALDTMDQPGLGASPDAATLVAGFDERSRRVMEEAEQRGFPADDETTGAAATGEWRVNRDDLDNTMPPLRLDGQGGDPSATTRMAPLKEQDLDFDFESDDSQPIDLDIGTATAGGDGGHSATQRINAEDLALPDLEPVTMSEVGTKLDLARAYMDMGDPEGARNILDEVLQEGSVTQKQEAQRLLESLPG